MYFFDGLLARAGRPAGNPGHERSRFFSAGNKGFSNHAASHGRFCGVRFWRWLENVFPFRATAGPDEGMSERASARVIFENLNICSKGCAALRPAEESSGSQPGMGGRKKVVFAERTQKSLKTLSRRPK
jgi:hypothetical protein